jgi:butyrate kinase
MERLLILNPGSTSTKLAVFDGEEPLFVESITHSAEELAPFDCVADQYEFRRELVLDCLKRHSVPLDSLTAIVSRGPSRRGPTRSTTTWCGSSRTSPRTSTPPTWAR